MEGGRSRRLQWRWNHDLLWYNSTSGELSAWLTDGYGNVTGALSINVGCETTSLFLNDAVRLRGGLEAGGTDKPPLSIFSQAEIPTKRHVPAKARGAFVRSLVASDETCRRVDCVAPRTSAFWALASLFYYGRRARDQFLRHKELVHAHELGLVLERANGSVEVIGWRDVRYARRHNYELKLKWRRFRLSEAYAELHISGGIARASPPTT